MDAGPPPALMLTKGDAMEGVVNAVTWLMSHWAELIAGVVGVFTGLYSLFLVIPGDQPDKTIAAILEFTQKWSRK